MELLKAQLEVKPSNAEIEAWKMAISELKAEKTECKAERSECKAELVAAKLDVNAEKLQCSKQIGIFQKLQEDLKSQCNQICVLRTKELNDNLEFKLQEIADLANKMQKKDTEIIEKNEEIKKLKKKFEILNQF